MNTCQRCNDPHQTDGNSCTNCGWMVGSPYTGQTYVQPQSATGWRQNLPLILGAILSVIAVVILAAFLMFRSSSAAPATTQTVDPAALNAALTQVALTPGASAAGLTALPLASATPAMPVECIPSLPGEVTKNIPAWCGPALTAIAATPIAEMPATATLPLPVLPSSTPIVVVIQTTAPAAEVCRLYKANTADENSTPADWIRVEVGGSNVQHVDAYARRGIKSVSYIVTAIASQETPDIWYMFGSVFEATDAPSCGTFDWESDTTQYARDRLDSGHSGLVIDLRSGSPVVVANVANMSQADINALLDENWRLFHDSSAHASASSAGSCQMTKQTHNPVVGQVWTLSGPGIVNFWSNQPGADQTEHKLLLSAGDMVNLLGGGTFWVAQPGCSVDADYANNPLPKITLDQLRSLGLVK